MVGLLFWKIKCLEVGSERVKRWFLSERRWTVAVVVVLVLVVVVVLVLVLVVLVDRFYIALFSALEQTHCARM